MVGGGLGGLSELGGAGAIDLYGRYGGRGSSLPVVKNPDQVYADITRAEYDDYIRDYRDFENQTIQKALTDTSLIDAAREDSAVAGQLADDMAKRNAQRYGAALTPAQQQQRDLMLQRANTLGGIQSVNDARIAQKEANTALLSDLINIGQGVNRSSQSQLGSAAADATARKNAYEQAKAASKAQTYQTVGGLASLAIMAFAF